MSDPSKQFTCILEDTATGEKIPVPEALFRGFERFMRSDPKPRGGSLIITFVTGGIAGVETTEKFTWK